MSIRTLNMITNPNKKPKPDPDHLVFGRHFSDHMFIMDYAKGTGWFNPRIVPYEPVTLDPAAMVFHYGQSVFEGLKAYRTQDNRILLFRPEKNLQRLNRSNERLSIPLIDEELVLDYLRKLISIDQDWVPSAEGTSLYIRPYIFATDPNLVPAPSSTYKLIIILSPVGSYYPEGINPVRINVEEEYTRAVRGGTGADKIAGNYAGAYNAQVRASENGYSQVLWLDGIEKKYIEEVGSMNVFFKINGEVLTPALSGSILEGITRMSVIELLNDWGIRVKERKISIKEIHEAYEKGLLEEAFGTGTAAVISPIGQLNWQEQSMVINDGKTGDLSKRLYDKLTGIQTGRLSDPYGWTIEVE